MVGKFSRGLLPRNLKIQYQESKQLRLQATVHHTSELEPHAATELPILHICVMPHAGIISTFYPRSKRCLRFSQIVLSH